MKEIMDINQLPKLESERDHEPLGKKLGNGDCHCVFNSLINREAAMAYPSRYKLKDINFFHLIILPVENWCNFRCKYCYEKFGSKIEFIRADVLEGIRNLIRNNVRKLNELRISWFGGEPLLAYNIIIDFMRFVNNLKDMYSFKLYSDITTNAYGLTLNRFKELVEFGVNEYEITFDGDEDFHDKLRVRLDGGPTFRTIYSHLIQMHTTSLEFDVTIRIHLNKYNKESIKRLLEKLHNDIGNDYRFKIFIRGISSLLDKDNKSLEYEDKNKLMRDLRELRQIAGNMGFRVVNGTGGICYASNPRSFVIKPDGSLAKCTVDLYTDRGKTGL